MLFRDYPLLNTPNLILVLLRAAEEGPATLGAAQAALAALLAQAHEHPPVGPGDVAPRLAMLVRYLAEARLVAIGADGSFALTPRGQDALSRHSEGFDVADLAAYPEFARYLRGIELRRTRPDDPRASGYDQGFYAYWSGATPAENPFAEDSADHLAWENGWSEAFDEDYRWSGPHADQLRGS
jgi:hypothetical protein